MGATLVGQGFSLLLYGMGLVFLFLTLLVMVTGAMSTLIGKFFPEEDEQPRLRAGNPAAVPADPRTLRIIEAAIAQHRSKTRR